MKAGKWVSYVLGGFIGLLVLAVILFFVIGDYLIKIGVEKGASSALKVPVEVKSVHLSVIHSSVVINGLRIGNPAGYELPQFLSLGEAKAAVSTGSLLSDTIDIDYIVLNGINLSVEQKGFGTNLQEILNSLPKSEAETQQAPGKKLRIKQLEISDVNVTLKLLPLPGKANKITIKLAPIKMENLGTDDGLSMATLTSKILVAIAAGVAKQATGILPEGLTNSIQSSLGKAGGIFSSGSKEVLDIGKGATEGIKNIFGGKKK
jgi:hypothetical protein